MPGLAEAEVTALHARGADTVRHTVDVDDAQARELFEGLGFEADVICLSLYRE